MRQNTILIILLIVFSKPSLLAQPNTNYPIFKSGIWLTQSTTSTGLGGSYTARIYQSSGDTIIGTEIYNILYEQKLICGGSSLPPIGAIPGYGYSPSGPKTYFGCYRNDSLAKKTYLLLKDSINEVLWYDFNLDTISPLPNMYSTSAAWHDLFIIEIDSFLLGGKYHKSYILDDDTISAFIPPIPTLHEGKGFDGDLIYVNSIYFEHYLSTEYCEDSLLNNFCETYVTGLYELKTRYDFAIFPNPTHDWINITSNEILISKIQLYSLDGRLIKTKDFSPSQTSYTLNTINIPSGLYLIQLFEENNLILGNKQKIVVLHD